MQIAGERVGVTIAALARDCERHRDDEGKPRPDVVVVLDDALLLRALGTLVHHAAPRIARENRMLFSRWMCSKSSASIASSPR
jgi:hypothetical protein